MLKRAIREGCFFLYLFRIPSPDGSQNIFHKKSEGVARARVQRKKLMKKNSEKVCLCQVKDFFKEYKPGDEQVSTVSLISDKKKIIKRICRVL